MTLSELYDAIEEARQTVTVNTAAAHLTALCPPGSAEAHAAADLRKALSHIDKAQWRLRNKALIHDRTEK